MGMYLNASLELKMPDTPEVQKIICDTLLSFYESDLSGLMEDFNVSSVEDLCKTAHVEDLLEAEFEIDEVHTDENGNNEYNASYNDDCVKIWIKQYSDDIFYPKIEFDTDRQEIQYDMTVDGDIREIHYKRFTGTKGRSRRIDIARDDLKPALRVIDDIIREGYGFTDYYTQSENDTN